MNAKRNPWLVLGLDYGADVSQAAPAMARRLHAIRAETDPSYDRKDLVWALNMIERIRAGTESDLEYLRLPSPEWPPNLPDGATGLFRPPPAALPRSTPPVTAQAAAELDHLARAFLRSVAEQLSQHLSDDEERT